MHSCNYCTAFLHSVGYLIIKDYYTISSYPGPWWFYTVPARYNNGNMFTLYINYQTNSVNLSIVMELWQKCNTIIIWVCSRAYWVTVLVIIKLTKFSVALRLRCGSCKLIFWHYFISLLNFRTLYIDWSHSASYQAPNYVQRS